MKREENWFRQQRQSLELTANALAQRIGVTERSVLNWERDRSVPQRFYWGAISNAFSVSVETLAEAVAAQSIRMIARQNAA